MNKTVTFGEIDLIPVDDSWEPPKMDGRPLPLLPVRCCIGPDPGYHVGSGGPFGILPYPDGDNLRNMAVVIAEQPVEISHAYYGETIVPGGRWRLYLRHDGIAPKEP